LKDGIFVIPNRWNMILDRWNICDSW